MSHTSTCEADEAHHDALHRVATGAERASSASALDPAPDSIRRRSGRIGGLLAVPELRWALVALVLFLIGLATTVAGAPAWLTAILFAGCYATGGWEPGLAGLRALRDKTLDVDLLMVAAALGAATIGQALDGALLIVIFATSGALEAIATKRTQDSVRALLDLAPERATRIRGADEQRVDAATLVVGDEILVRPGERIGADGIVVDGASEVDQASITGEPLPVFRQPGDEVFAGSLNGEGVLHVRVERPAAESVIARIVALVEEASATKAETQLFVEGIEQRYSIGMVCATVALFAVPLMLGDALQPTLLRAMTFMIVASPCAVMLATMPPLLAAIANAGRHGVLVKSAVVMERLGTTTQAAFDKTGTLTEGTPRIADVHVVDDVSSEEVVLRLAAGAERSSEHPLARAVVDAARIRELAIPSADDFSSSPGRGVTARVDGRVVSVGSPRLLDAAAHSDPKLRASRTISSVEAEGHTALVVVIDGTPVAVLGAADRLRPDALATVAELERLTGNPALLLTGDNAGAARRLAADVGITEFRAGLLPQDKVTEVRALQDAGASVLVVGDGVNDAPALAAAHVGIAMGRHGSDLALETADAVIVRDDLTTIPAAIDISRRARRLVTANLVFAAVVIVGLVAVDLLGRLPLPLGVAGHEGSTIVVGLNGLRLLKRSAWGTALRT